VSAIQSIDARTGLLRSEHPETTRRELDEVCRRAQLSSAEWSVTSRRERAALLRAMSGALLDSAEELAAVADSETALGKPRLVGEVGRTAYQLRFFGDVLEDGGYLEATIDHAGESDIGPVPDLRRILQAVGPVAVFGASNFPFAFSTLGGDTASALAAGCAVVVKAHPSHPETSIATMKAIRVPLAELGVPADIIQIVHGQEAGRHLVAHPAVRAVGFTGSVAGGAALARVAHSRSDPIPFYGELGSVNPLIVTPRAAAERGMDIGQGFAESFSLGAGQFCTKPGLAFIPAGAAGDELASAAARTVSKMSGSHLLNAGIRDAYTLGVLQMGGLPNVSVVAEGSSGGRAVPHMLLSMTSTTFRSTNLEECFGPVALMVRYDHIDDLLDCLHLLAGSLAAALHAGEQEDVRGLSSALSEKVGRVVFDGWPTGVAVSWAMEHGGPWPATNSLHTSVGSTAIRRFVRPISFQNAPEAVLPPELRDGEVTVPTRINGTMVLPVIAPRSA